MIRAVFVVVVALALVPIADGSDKPSLASLEGEVMCPVCGTTLDQSDAPAALQIKRFIRRRIAAGDSEREIKAALVANYGESILAAPPKRGFGLLAWWVPLGGIVVAAAALAAAIWRWSRRREGDAALATGALDPGLERRLDAELKRLE